jgi:hypothetical protein
MVFVACGANFYFKETKFLKAGNSMHEQKFSIKTLELFFEV